MQSIHFVRTITLVCVAALGLGGCATTIEGLRTSGRWLISQTNDRPEDADVHPGHNDASAYSQYETERALLLSASVDDKRASMDRAQLRQRVLALAPIGSDIAAAKISLELNGFDCAWISPRHGAIGCGSSRFGDPLRVRILARNHAVIQVAVSASRPAR